jgi:hypothetical protein
VNSSAMYRKIVTALPVFGVAESARALGQKAIKKSRGTLGANRLAAAEWLACHFLECDCQLTQAIVVELYNGSEMEAFKEINSYEEVAQYLAMKMKSTLFAAGHSQRAISSTLGTVDGVSPRHSSTINSPAAGERV